jgi:biopolymer transport protein ExbD
MRFPRQARIIHGQLDVAAWAGVGLVLLIFIQLRSLLPTPGVLVHLDNPANPAAVIKIAEDGRIHFGTNVFTVEETNRLRDAIKHSAAGPPFDLRVDPGAPPNLAARASNAVTGIFDIRLPRGPSNLIGTYNPTVMVRVNFLGQYIYDNETVDERTLKARLAERLQAASRQSRELTLTIAADAQANLDAVTRLERWAHEVGIKEAILAEWLEKPSGSKPPP